MNKFPPPSPRPVNGREYRSPKIQTKHWDRLAIVYVRQSSAHQMIDHPESLARQYDLANYAQTLGWSADHVLVIDQDQGISGRHASHRAGFQRLLTEVTLNNVGIVLGLEMSRLARSCKDWHHLLELCALCDTLLADQDGIYNPADSNDRLLLGLKGTMSEFELFTMRNRLQRGQLNKAQRGEMFIVVPFGYYKLPTGQVVLDPDEQVQNVVRLIFTTFDQQGSVNATMRQLIQQKVQLGIRARGGPRQGQIEWHRPTRSTLFHVLHSPLYAGAYVYGRKPLPPTPVGTRGLRDRVEDEWRILIRDKLPAYITWNQFLANQERLRQNRALSTTRGSLRRGTALLGGVLQCATCGRRLAVRYRSPEQPYYVCEKSLEECRSPTCAGVTASGLDAMVAQQVQAVLAPAAMELHLQVLDDRDQQRRQQEKLCVRRQLEFPISDN
jgi:DNA invertase Pin-like site-specific DNA recombinase